MQGRLDGFEHPFHLRFYKFKNSEICHLFIQPIKRCYARHSSQKSLNEQNILMLEEDRQ